MREIGNKLTQKPVLLKHPQKPAPVKIITAVPPLNIGCEVFFRIKIVGFFE